jgi:hypothetical protein
VLRKMAHHGHRTLQGQRVFGERDQLADGRGGQLFDLIAPMACPVFRVSKF